MVALPVFSPEYTINDSVRQVQDTVDETTPEYQNFMGSLIDEAMKSQRVYGKESLMALLD